MSFLMHGERIADPYRWLGDDRAADVEAWVHAQMASFGPGRTIIPLAMHSSDAWPASTSGRPVLLRVDRKGGRGAAGLTRRIQQVLDGSCFLPMELTR